MANTILITANWHTGALSQQTISRQYDNNRYVVQFVGYPEASEGNELDYYLLVWMSSAPGERPDEIAPIQLASDQWYISNVFTQQTQQIKFQMCALNTEGTFEAHSPIFTGFVRNSLEHDGTTQDIDVSTLFDAYREYLNELIIRSGAVVIDSVPTQGSANAVSSGGVYSALHDTDTTLSQSGQAADAKVVGDEISELKSDLSELAEIAESKNIYNSTLIRGNVSSSGVVKTTPDGTSTRTGYIEVDGGETYIASYIDSTTSSYNVFVSEFTSDKTFIKRTNITPSAVFNPPFTVESTCKYIILHWTYTVEAELSNIQIEKGTTITPYEPFEYIVKVDKVTGYEDCLNRVSDLEGSIDEALRTDNTDFTTPKNTLFAIELTSSKYIAANGTISDITNTHYKVSQYIDVSGIKSVWVSANGDFKHGVAAFYKDDYSVDSVPLKAASGGTITQFINELLPVPSTAKYLVLAGIDQVYNPSGYYQSGYKLKKWTGLKWAAVGDSLTEVNVRTTMHYHDYIAQETGITVINMGRSGTGYKRQYEDNLAFYQRIASVPTDADVVTIFGSGNDQLYYSDADIGTATDIFDADNPENNTLGACINHTIDVLYSVIPTVQLGIIAPCPWTNYNPANHNNGMAKYTELLRQICYNRSIPFLDMYHESNLRPWDAAFRELAYSKDGGSGTHPDETGHKLMAGRFRVFLDGLLGITDKQA